MDNQTHEKALDDAQREAALDELTAESERLGLYYEPLEWKGSRWMCPTCAAVVTDPAKHQAWHYPKGGG